jgi:hypothetical protein
MATAQMILQLITNLGETNDVRIALSFNGRAEFGLYGFAMFVIVSYRSLWFLRTPYTIQCDFELSAT